jgi:hypothetical protein
MPIWIDLVLGQFLQTKRLIRFAPTVHVGLAHSDLPHLIKVANLPVRALSESDQSIPPFFPE